MNDWEAFVNRSWVKIPGVAACLEQSLPVELSDAVWTIEANGYRLEAIRRARVFLTRLAEDITGKPKVILFLDGRQ